MIWMESNKIKVKLIDVHQIAEKIIAAINFDKKRDT